MTWMLSASMLCDTTYLHICSCSKSVSDMPNINLGTLEVNRCLSSYNVVDTIPRIPLCPHSGLYLQYSTIFAPIYAAKDRNM
ncbi:hypothetical protein F5B21DRAFT_486068 [Xylaria acuta]|nr:hypothetical protein F5B21DRAFT_486068 [Xylaria acuta]